MSNEIRVGDRVRLLGLPDWATDELPEDEQIEMRSFVSQCSVVSEVDIYGYYWIGFGCTTEVGDSAHYSGHSFCVPREFIEPV